MLGVFVVAAIGVYLLALAAIALVGWLVRLAIKSASPPTATNTAAELSTPPVAPHREYHAIVAFDASVFSERRRAEATARNVFGAWVARIPSGPKDPSDLVRAVTISTRFIGRLTTELEGRRFVWRAAPRTGRAALGDPPVDPKTLDPWNPPRDLRRASTYVSSCWTCDGEGKIACVPCGGSGRRTCNSCNGAGQSYGVAANGARRMLNCTECRGRCTVVCHACSRGNVDCPTCHKAKKLECWLEVDESSRQDVQVEPDGAMTKAFAWGQDGVRASHTEIAQDAWIRDGAERARALTLADLPQAVPDDWRQKHWQSIQARIEPGERIRSQTFTLLEVPTTAVDYLVVGEHRRVTFEGLRMLAPPGDIANPFAKRATTLRRLRYVLGALPIASLIIYLARGSYFMTERTGPIVAGLIAAAVVTAVCVYGVVWCATLGRRAARRWALVAVAPIVAACVCAVLAEPSISRARASIEAGRLDQARFELDALGSPGDSELSPLWADIHLQESLAAASCPAAAERMAKIPAEAPQHSTARAHADALAVAASEASLQAGAFDDARSALACASDELRGGPSAKALRARIEISAASRCASARNWPCVFERTKDASDFGASTDADAVRGEAVAAIRVELDEAVAASRSEKRLDQRVRLQAAALDLWGSYLASDNRPEPPAIAKLRATQARDEQALARQEEVARQREQARAERERKLQAAQEERERRQRAAEEARQNRESMGLLCCDGSMSPSCSCGGSHQGCCSHHGGVCGCR